MKLFHIGGAAESVVITAHRALHSAQSIVCGISTQRSLLSRSHRRAEKRITSLRACVSFSIKHHEESLWSWICQIASVSRTRPSAYSGIACQV